MSEQRKLSALLEKLDNTDPSIANPIIDRMIDLMERIDQAPGDEDEILADFQAKVGS